jgi:Putative transposase/Transposase zinc-binding domain
VHARHPHAASTSSDPGDDYERRRPEDTVLLGTVQEHWRTFLADLEARAEPPALPAFVVAEVEAFLRCGILAHGFVLARCGDCGWSRPVAFSCQRRGFCPSCIGRRMADFAAHLVDRVAPTSVPLRQWVLTVPHRLRARMMYDPALTTLVLRELIAAVSSWLRRRARRLGIRGALKAGAVAVVQRFNSALDASPHFHTLFLDGVYSFPVGSTPVFHPTPAPRDEDIARVAAAVCRRVERKLSEREPAAPQRHFEESAQLWCALAGASVAGVAATGPRRGRYLVRVRGARADVDAIVTGRLCADVAGFNLQAATRIAANDRAGIERMARYLARPPIATDRLSRLDDGRLELQLKRPWRDGTTAFVLTPHELIERLVALVPRPRAHLTRYFGVFAPAFAARAAIVPPGVTKTPRARGSRPR